MEIFFSHLAKYISQIWLDEEGMSSGTEDGPRLTKRFAAKSAECRTRIIMRLGLKSQNRGDSL